MNSLRQFSNQLVFILKSGLRGLWWCWSPWSRALWGSWLYAAGFGAPNILCVSGNDSTGCVQTAHLMCDSTSHSLVYVVHVRILNGLEAYATDLGAGFASMGPSGCMFAFVWVISSLWVDFGPRRWFLDSFGIPTVQLDSECPARIPQPRPYYGGDSSKQSNLFCNVFFDSLASPASILTDFH